MPLLHVESLPRRVTKSDLFAFLGTLGGLDRRRVGRIELRGKEATIEIPDGWQSRLVKALDGQLLGDRRVRVWADGLAPIPLAAAKIISSGSPGSWNWKAKQKLARQPNAAGGCLPLTPNGRARVLVDLVIADEDTGLGGRFLVQLVKRGAGPRLPWTRLNVGSPVVLSPQEAGVPDGWRGVVLRAYRGLASRGSRGRARRPGRPQALASGSLER